MKENVISLENVRKVFKVSDCETIFDYLRLKHLRKKKEIVAVDGITFDIKAGEFVGLLGVNGAGKSTLIKMMTGIMLPSSGKITVLGNNPFEKRIENNYKIGAVFGQRCQLRWDIAAIESYRLFQAIYRIPHQEFEERLSYLSDILELGEFINQPVRTLSLGQKMRAELAGAFLHKPDIIFLDEPTIGLDVLSKEAIINFLIDCKKTRETTIIFTTHDMEDVKQLCERLIIVNNGKVFVDDTITNLEKYTKLNTNVKVKIRNENICIPKELEKMSYEMSDREITFKTSEEKEVTTVIEYMFSANMICEVDIIKPEFKDIFKRVVSEQGETNESI